MYSVVLLMSMTAAPETPNFGGRLFHHGCYGSCHGCWSSCHGCWSSCQGCYGGGIFAHKSWGGCSGCYGGCSGCYGGCWANTSSFYPGYWTPYSCHGYYGAYGGASYTWPTPYYYSGSSCYGYGYPMAPVYPKVEDKKEKEKEKGKEEPKKTYLPAAPDQARVIVRLPGDAKLYANGHLTTLTSGERDFTTPSLEKGRDFQYAMKIEYVRDGKTITDNQVVKVRAGEVSLVSFVDQARAETVTSKVTVNLPQGAKLFVEDQPRNLPVGVKEFQTPQLQKGVEYTYSFRAELVKDGKTVAKTQRVMFKAGEPVNVDFTDMETSTTASNQ